MSNNEKQILVVENQGHYQELFSFLPNEKFLVKFTENFSTALQDVHQINPSLIMISIDENKNLAFDNSRKFRFSQEVQNTPMIFFSIKNYQKDTQTPEMLSRDANEYSSIELNKEGFIAMLSDIFENNISLSECLMKSKLRLFLETIGIGIHDINQPLTSILCNSELIMRSITDTDPSYKRVNVIYNSITRVIEIMREMQMLKRDVIKNVTKEVFVLDLN